LERLFKKISQTLFLFLAFGLTRSSAQDNDVEFVVKTIKESYAGYHDKVTNKEFDSFVKRQINDRDTFKLLSAIANYFEDQHLKIFRYNTRKYDTILGQKNIKMISAYFSNRNIKDKREGYWVNDYNNCVIALKKVKNNPVAYKAYIVESRKDAIPIGTIYADFICLKGDKFLTDFMTPKGGFSYYLISEFKNDTTFTSAPSSKWRKLINYKGSAMQSLPEYNYSVTATLLDKDNYLITIPGSTEQNTKILDSIVKDQYQIISSTKNLIIDIRNNLGGTVRTYAPLFPFIYTNPIQKISGYLYYSKAMMNAEQLELNEYRGMESIDTALIKQKENSIARISGNIGRVLYDGGTIVKLDSTKKYPQNVAVIANYACYSASEMMILDFKQSKKVTLFGERTFGAVDYLDDFSIDLPSKKYVLDIASFKRAIPKGGTRLDGIGIIPDVPIPDGDSDWVEFVRNYYKKK
jgi:hypothetical protein